HAVQKAAEATVEIVNDEVVTPGKETSEILPETLPNEADSYSHQNVVTYSTNSSGGSLPPSSADSAGGSDDVEQTPKAATPPGVSNSEENQAPVPSKKRMIVTPVTRDIVKILQTSHIFDKP